MTGVVIENKNQLKIEATEKDFVDSHGKYFVIRFEKGKENTPPYSTNFDKCDKVSVCDTSTTPGKIVTVTKDVANSDKNRYVDPGSDKCKDEPKEIPSTGPAEIISGITGVGALAGSTSMYIRSRRALRK